MILAVNDIIRSLVFPLVVLVVAALFTGLFTGLFIPSLHRRRDDHRRANELRTQLVSEMSDVVIGFVTASRFAFNGTVSQSSADYEDAYKTWERGRAVLGTKLEAYFPGIEREWREFVDRVEELYDLSQEEASLRNKKSRIGQHRQVSRPSTTKAERIAVWEQREEDILNRKRRLIIRVRDSPVDGLETRPA